MSIASKLLPLAATLWAVLLGTSGISAEMLEDVGLKAPELPNQARAELRKLLTVWDEKIRTEPNSAGHYTARASIWCRLEKFDFAIADAKAAIRLDPRANDGHLWLGTALAMSGKHAPAILELKKAVELGADKAIAYRLLAACRTNTGDDNGALRDLDAAINASMDDKAYLATLRFQRGWLRRGNGDSASAATDFNEIVHLFPHAPASYQWRGAFKLSQEDWRGAFDDLENALRLDDPQQPRYRNLVALLPVKSPANDQGKPDLPKVLCERTEWKNWLALAIYADWLFESGQYDESMKWLSTSIELAPKDMKEQLRSRQRDRGRRSPFRASGSDDGRIGPN